MLSSKSFHVWNLQPCYKMVWGFVLVSGLVHFPKDPHVRVVESQ